MGGLFCINNNCTNCFRPLSDDKKTYVVKSLMDNQWTVYLDMPCCSLECQLQAASWLDAKDCGDARLQKRFVNPELDRVIVHPAPQPFCLKQGFGGVLDDETFSRLFCDDNQKKIAVVHEPLEQQDMIHPDTGIDELVRLPFVEAHSCRCWSCGIFENDLLPFCISKHRGFGAFCGLCLSGCHHPRLRYWLEHRRGYCHKTRAEKVDFVRIKWPLWIPDSCQRTHFLSLIQQQ